MTPREIAFGILGRLQEADHEAYLVGGCVRALSQTPRRGQELRGDFGGGTRAHL